MTLEHHNAIILFLSNLIAKCMQNTNKINISDHRFSLVFCSSLGCEKERLVQREYTED